MNTLEQGYNQSFHPSLLDIPTVAVATPLQLFLNIIGGPAMPSAFTASPYRFGDVAFDDSPSEVLHSSLKEMQSSLRRGAEPGFVEGDFGAAPYMPVDVPVLSEAGLNYQDAVFAALATGTGETGGFDAGSVTVDSAPISISLAA